MIMILLLKNFQTKNNFLSFVSIQKLHQISRFVSMKNLINFLQVFSFVSIENLFKFLAFLVLLVQEISLNFFPCQYKKFIKSFILHTHALKFISNNIYKILCCFIVLTTSFSIYILHTKEAGSKFMHIMLFNKNLNQSKQFCT